jgi:hypothetical protein
MPRVDLKDIQTREVKMDSVDAELYAQLQRNEAMLQKQWDWLMAQRKVPKPPTQAATVEPLEFPDDKERGLRYRPPHSLCRWHQTEDRVTNAAGFRRPYTISSGPSFYREMPVMETWVKQEHARRHDMAVLAVKRSLREWPVCGRGGEVRLEHNKNGDARWSCSCDGE